MNAPITLSILALVLLGIGTFFTKIAAVHQVYSPSYMMVASLSTCVVAIIIHLVQIHSFELSAKMAVLSVLGGIIGGMGFYAILVALRLGGEGSIVFPISGLGVIVAVILAFVVYREPVTVTKLLGLGLGVSSIVVLSR
jgi:uncharacterized membrane protein